MTKQGITSSFRFKKTKQSAKSNKQYKSSLTTVSKTITSSWASTEMFFVGKGWGGRLLTFWAFRVGAYLRWPLIRRWAVNRINTVYRLCRRPSIRLSVPQPGTDLN